MNDLDSPDSVVRRWFDEVWNAGREESIERLMAPNALVHGLGGEVMIGPAPFITYFRTMRTALRPIEVTVVRTVVEGEMVVAHCHVTARHSGASLGGPQTGRTVDFWGMTMARVVDGQIVEGWNSFDVRLFTYFLSSSRWVSPRVFIESSRSS